MQNRGRLQLIIGNMFANKTGWLIHEIETLREFGRKKILVLKPDIDTRSTKGHIQNFHGKVIPAFEVSTEDIRSAFECISQEERIAGSRFNVIAFDEIQFFPYGFETVNTLLAMGYDVIAAGLKLDFRGLPFGCTLSLIGLCQNLNDVTILNSRCARCGAEATLPQRIIDGNPAAYNSPVVQVGGNETYEPRCYHCFELPGKPKILL